MTSVMVMWACGGELVIPLLVSILFDVISQETLPWAVLLLFGLAGVDYLLIKLAAGVNWKQWITKNHASTGAH